MGSLFAGADIITIGFFLQGVRGRDRGVDRGMGMGMGMGRDRGGMSMEHGAW